MVLHKMRVWDRMSADRVDAFIANSETVAERIRKYYDRDAEVIYPPVETSKFAIADKKEDYFLAGGRLVPYKRFDLIIEAFNRTGLPLIIFGDGPLYDEYVNMAKSNIRFAGRVSEERKAELYAKAKAFINPQEEDFGITAVEAMASGTPVIAYRKGGAMETVLENDTGVFFDEQEWEDLAATVIRFEDMTFDPKRIREHAMTFDTEIFKKKIQSFVRRHAPQNEDAHDAMSAYLKENSYSK